MTPDVVVDLFRQAILMVIFIVGILVLPALGMGLLVAIFQAATQINEQTLSFIPRLFIVFLSFVIAGPWLLNKMINYTQALFENIMMYIG